MTVKLRLLGVIMLLIAAMSAARAAGQPFDDCPESVRCIPLFENNGEITLVRYGSNAAYFRNPQITLSVRIEADRLRAETRPLRLTLDRPTIYRILGDQNTCDLLVAGIDNENSIAGSRYFDVPVPVPAGEIAVSLYTFCEDFNLPTTTDFETMNVLMLPSGAFPTPPNVDRLTSPDTVAALGSVFARAADGLCIPTPDAAPLTLRSFATQIAVFITLDRVNNPNWQQSMWDRYTIDLQNQVFARDYAGIYCLLSAMPPPLTAAIAPAEARLAPGGSVDYDLSVVGNGRGLYLTAVPLATWETAPPACPLPQGEDAAPYRPTLEPEQRRLTFDTAGGYVVQGCAAGMPYLPADADGDGVPDARANPIANLPAQAIAAVDADARYMATAVPPTLQRDPSPTPTATGTLSPGEIVFMGESPVPLVSSLSLNGLVGTLAVLVGGFFISAFAWMLAHTGIERAAAGEAAAIRAGRISAARVRLRRILIVLIALGSLLAAVILVPRAAAQDAPPTTTAPPSLLLVIVIDDSRTNFAGMSSSVDNGNNAYNYTVGDRPSDPERLRADAVRRVVDSLRADALATHQIAAITLSVATPLNGIGNWLTTNAADPNDRFMGAGREGAAESQWEAFYSRLAGVQLPTAGPGRLAEALSLAAAAIDTRLAAGNPNNLKPVVLLIADDVPINPTSFATGPFTAGAVSWLGSDYVGEFNRALDRLGAIVTDYESETCAHTNGGAVLAMLTLGAANAVRPDGSVVTPTINQDPAETYYGSLAAARGWLTLQGGAPLVWPIDPLFNSESDRQRDFTRAIDAFLPEIRCTWSDRTGVSPALTVDGRQYRFMLSNAVTQARFTIDAPANAPIGFIAPNGESYAPIVPAVTGADTLITAGDGSRRIYALPREQFGENWAGEWRIDTGGVDLQSVSVYWEREIEIGGLTVAGGSTIGFTLGGGLYTFPLQLQLSGGLPLTDQTVIDAVNVSAVNRVNQAPAAAPIADFADGGYTIEIPPSLAESGASYDVIGAGRLARALGSLPAGSSFALPRTSVEFRASAGMNIEAPGDLAQWCARADQDSEPFIVTVSGVSGDQNELDSLGSASRVEVQYGAVGAPPEATPIATLVLRPNAQGKFVGAFDCRVIVGVPGERQQAVVRAVVPGQAPMSEAIVFLFNPTATYTPTATPTQTPTIAATGTATATATPPPATLVPVPPTAIENAVVSLGAPPLSYLVIGVIGGGLIAVALRLIRSYTRLLPLLKVEVRVDEEDRRLAALGRAPLLAPPAGWLWLAHRAGVTFHDPAGSAIFTVRRARDRDRLEIAAFQPVEVNGQRLMPGGAPLPVIGRDFDVAARVIVPMEGALPPRSTSGTVLITAEGIVGTRREEERARVYHFINRRRR